MSRRSGAARRVLGIDPGSQITGFGIVEEHDSGLHCLASGVIVAGRAAPKHAEMEEDGGNLPQRLYTIYNGLSGLVERFKPQILAAESVFHSVNPMSALKLGHARGVALLIAGQFNLEFHEYAPRSIKKGLTGSGAASKEQVQKMVRLLLGGTMPSRLDAADALAVAIFHCHSLPSHASLLTAGNR